MVVDKFWLGYQQVTVGQGDGDQRTVTVPVLGVFIHPDLGLRLPGLDGPMVEPPPDRVLRLWADNLLTVTSGRDWKLIVNVAEPFDQDWLDTLFPPAEADADLVICVRAHSTLPPSGDGPVSSQWLESFAPSTWVHIEDCRR